MRKKFVLGISLAMTMMLVACGSKSNTKDKSQNIVINENALDENSEKTDKNEEKANEFDANPDDEETTVLNTKTYEEMFAVEAVSSAEDMFTDRDCDTSYEEYEKIVLSDEGSSSSSKNVEIEDNTITITGKGTYLISGTLSKGQIIVNADEEDKVQLVLENVSITNENNAAIYVVNADKVFVTTTNGSKNMITSVGVFEENIGLTSGENADETTTDNNVSNIDGAIFSKSDIVFNGEGTLNVTSEAGHGIVSKDDLKITSGTYDIVASKQGIEGKDSIRIAGGTITIDCGKDGLHSENDEEAEKGYIYICGGDISISAEDDGMHAGYTLDILDGTIDVMESYEGLEAAYIRILGGNVSVDAEDDGLNATDGTSNDMFGGMEPGNMKPSEFGGERPEMPDGNNGEFGGERPEMPDGNNGEFGGERPEMPDGNNGEFGGERPEMPDGNNGEFGSERPEMPNGNFGGQRQDLQTGAFGEGSDYCGIWINGGNLKVNADGDGIDSNGALLVSDGEIYVNGPTNGGNGALDYAKAGTVTGGTLIATGSTGMAQNFGSASTQASVLYYFDSKLVGGTTLSVIDNQENVIAKITPEKDYECVVVSCKELKVGETYKFVVENEMYEFTLEQLLFSNNNKQIR